MKKKKKKNGYYGLTHIIIFLRRKSLFEEIIEITLLCAYYMIRKI